MSFRNMRKQVRFDLAEGPAFLTEGFIELEETNTIAIGVINRSGDVYAFMRISKEELQNSLHLLTDGKGLLGA